MFDKSNTWPMTLIKTYSVNVIKSMNLISKRYIHYRQKDGYTKNIGSILEYMVSITSNGIVNKEAIVVYGTAGSGKGKLLDHYKTIDPKVNQYINLNLDNHIYNSNSYKSQVHSHNITILKQIISDLKKKHNALGIKYTLCGRIWTEKLDVLNKILSDNLNGNALSLQDITTLRYFITYLLHFEKPFYDLFMTSTIALYYAHRNTSELINETMLNLALYFGNGIIFETTGKNLASMSNTLKKISDKGYNIVFLYPFVSDIEILHKRVLSRGIVEGRFLSFDNFATTHQRSIDNYNTYIRQYLQINVPNTKRIIIADNSTSILKSLYDYPTHDIQSAEIMQLPILR